MKTGAIDIYSKNINARDFELSLNQLLLNGWSANKNGLIVYVADDSYELLSEPFNDDSLNKVKQILFNNIENNLNTSIDLVYGNNDTVIGFHFMNDKQIMITVPEKVTMMDGVGIIDFSWYLNKVKSIFTILDFYRVVCSFD